MTTIGLLSDTHSFLDPKVLHHFAEVDEIWHAGDFGSLDVIDQLKALKPLRGVYGNIDNATIRREYPEVLHFECDGVPILMTHIAGYPGKYTPKARILLETDAPAKGIFICGHSHILKAMPDKKYDFLHLNPGACGNEGWHAVKTLMRLKLDAGKILGLEVIEIGNRR